MIDIDWLLLPTTLAKLMISTAMITLLTLLIGPTAPYGRFVFIPHRYWNLIWSVLVQLQRVSRLNYTLQFSHRWSGQNLCRSQKNFFTTLQILYHWLGFHDQWQDRLVHPRNMEFCNPSRMAHSLRHPKTTSTSVCSRQCYPHGDLSFTLFQPRFDIPV